MRATYLWLSRLIAALVVIQAMTIVFAVAGMFNWIGSGGGSVDETVYKGWQSGEKPPFPEAIGHLLHLKSGEMVIPTLALLLLLVALFAKVPKGVAIAAAILVLVVVQAWTGIEGDHMPYLGLWHGLGAFLIFGAAMAGAMAAKKSPEAG